MNFRPGQLTIQHAQELNRLSGIVNRLDKLNVSPPLELRGNVLSARIPPVEVIEKLSDSQDSDGYFQGHLFFWDTNTREYNFVSPICILNLNEDTCGLPNQKFLGKYLGLNDSGIAVYGTYCCCEEPDLESSASSSSGSSHSEMSSGSSFSEVSSASSHSHSESSGSSVSELSSGSSTVSDHESSMSSASDVSSEQSSEQSEMLPCNQCSPGPTPEVWFFSVFSFAGICANYNDHWTLTRRSGCVWSQTNHAGATATLSFVYNFNGLGGLWVVLEFTGDPFSGYATYATQVTILNGYWDCCHDEIFPFSLFDSFCTEAPNLIEVFRECPEEASESSSSQSRSESSLSSSSLSDVSTVVCCGMAGFDLFISIEGGGPLFDGDVRILTWQTLTQTWALFSETWGTCEDLLVPVFILGCTGQEEFQLQVINVVEHYFASSVQCDPLQIVFEDVDLTSCGGTTGATLTVTLDLP